jgi:hypothetical protein
MEGEALGGDSGEPIYQFNLENTNQVYLYGIAWGGRRDLEWGIDYVWYSPINNIATDFGPYWSWQTY